ncbi:hypothetical protein HMPREF3198_01658 [Winkia neuii]|nr:hypothetical protein HMPREF3198_01658 [Winkia neuii]
METAMKYGKSFSNRAPPLEIVIHSSEMSGIIARTKQIETTTVDILSLMARRRFSAGSSGANGFFLGASGRASEDEDGASAEEEERALEVLDIFWLTSH